VVVTLTVPDDKKPVTDATTRVASGREEAPFVVVEAMVY
jgi:hypothetical protein